jgi:hypothetical protein
MLSENCRFTFKIKDLDQYLSVNIQEGKVDLNLRFLLLQKNSNENKTWKDILLQGDVPRKVSNGNQIWRDKQNNGL